MHFKGIRIVTALAPTRPLYPMLKGIRIVRGLDPTRPLYPVVNVLGYPYRDGVGSYTPTLSNLE
eukprot:1135174-Pyramimonas_sp.AAC.1